MNNCKDSEDRNKSSTIIIVLEDVLINLESLDGDGVVGSLEVRIQHSTIFITVNLNI